MPRRTPREARRRALGQNFLHDQSVVAETIGTRHPPPGALVVDLGAGAGALTKAAAQRGTRVVAVELDPYYVRVPEPRLQRPRADARATAADTGAERRRIPRSATPSSVSPEAYVRLYNAL